MFPANDSNNTKFVLDRINQAEKYLGSICVNVGKICRKEARLRDCNDELVQNMFEFADREKINTSLRQSLQQYASYLSAVEDYRNTLIARIENQMLEPLAKYGEIMKLKRQAVQKAISARDKGTVRQRKLQQTSARNPGNRDAIVAMQVNAEDAQNKASRADNVVQDEIDQFEQMKLTDIKKYLTDFTLIHLSFHARAIEMYTYAQQQLMNIDIAHDLEEFRTAAPFHRLHPSQRSVSETALNNPKRTIASGFIGAQSGSMGVLTNNRLDSEFGSNSSLPAGNNPYRGGPQKSQSMRSSTHTSSLTHDYSSKPGSKGKPIQPNVIESLSSGSESDD